MNKNSTNFLRLALTTLLFAGACSKSPYETAPVNGVVTLDGRPMTEGRVMFAPAAKDTDGKGGKPAFGTIGPEGTFVLSTYRDQDGAIVGKHWVTIIQTVVPKNTDRTDPNTAETVKFNRYKVPQQQTVIADGPNTFEFELTSSMLSE